MISQSPMERKGLFKEFRNVLDFYGIPEKNDDFFAYTMIDRRGKNLKYSKSL